MPRSWSRLKLVASWFDCIFRLPEDLAVFLHRIAIALRIQVDVGGAAASRVGDSCGSPT